MADARPTPGVVRVRQGFVEIPDRRSGGGVRKMFRAAKDRLQYLAGTLPSALDDFRTAYPGDKSSMPYLVLSLEPSAIAKAHSAVGVLEDQGLRLVGARRLEERVIHGSEQAFQKLNLLVAHAADLAPTDKELEAWDQEEKQRKRQAKEESEKVGKKVSPQPVRRSLRSKELSWNQVAQLSTIAAVGVVRPEDKLLLDPPAELGRCPTFVTTFPLVGPLGKSPGDDLNAWRLAIEEIAKINGLDEIHVLRGPREALARLGKVVSGSKLWSLDKSEPNPFLAGASFILLVHTESQNQRLALAGLPFIQTIEPSSLGDTAAPRKASFKLSPPPSSPTRLPIVGLVDTGIPAPSQLDPFILHRRGEDAIRSLANGHAADVAYLLVQDGHATPWRRSSDLACGVVDVARVDGRTTDAQVCAAVTEATLHGDDVGTVNLSANARRNRGSGALPYVSALGALLDEQSLESPSLTIVVSAGNSGSVGMDPPADAVHAVSVGAVSRRPDGSVTRSDYSCHGGGIAHNVKPTIVVPVHDSNAHDPSWTTRTPSGSTGTSIAAPVVARLHANLVHRGFTRDEALALMVHNAAYPDRGISHKPSVDELEEFGFGVVPTLDECDPPDRARFSMLYDVFAVRGQVRSLELPVPANLAGQSAFVRLTSYVRSPVRREAGEEYIAAEVPTRLRLHCKNRATPHVDLPPEPENIGERYERHRVEYGWKWAVLRRYSARIAFDSYSKFSLRVGPTLWREWAQLTRQSGSGEEGAGVRVQCVLTFYPLTDDAPSFFDAFYSAFAQHKIKMETVAEARLEIEP
jgi:hypothetical protein